MSENQSSVTLSLRVAIAATGLGAGAIHLAMVPGHARDSLALGIGFVVVGSLQAVVGVAAAARPRRRHLLSLMAVHAFAVAAWLWSRTAGLPVGAHAGEPEAIASVDATTVALQLVGLALAGVAWASTRSPRHASRTVRRAATFAAALVSVGALMGTSAVLASPNAVHDHGDTDHHETADSTEATPDHGHGSHGDAEHGHAGGHEDDHAGGHEDDHPAGPAASHGQGCDHAH